MALKLRELSQGECYGILEHARFGHLACCRDGQPYIAAIYFSFAGDVAYSFSMPGRKLDWMRANDKVCLHVEHLPSGGGWTSVVIEGRFQEFPDNGLWHDERVHAWSLLQRHSDWWEIGSLKPAELPVLSEPPHVFYGISIGALSGRSAGRDD
jgi:nitroimidazol reductase NimA-like FMN-containing flavoprotein (pyridoxamine 5'-phosphate oxidase superfamily)